MNSSEISSVGENVVVDENTKLLPKTDGNGDDDTAAATDHQELNINNEDGEQELGVVKDIEEQKETQNSFCCHKYLGLLLSMLSAAVFTLGTVFVKELSDYHPFTIGVYTFQGLFLPLIPFMLYARYAQKVKIFEPLWPLTLKENGKTFIFIGIRGILGWVALTCLFYSLRYLTVANATIIGSSKPITVSIFANIILGEKCGIFPVFVAILTILGMVIILRPPIAGKKFDEKLMIGAGYAFAGVIAQSLVIVAIRRLRTVHFSVVLFAFGCWGTILSLICALAFGVFEFPRNTDDSLNAFGWAAVMFVAQIVFNFALQLEEAGPVTLMRASEAVFAFIWQYILLGVKPDAYSLIGGAIVLFAVSLTALRKYIESLPEDNPTRKRCCCILK